MTAHCWFWLLKYREERQLAPLLLGFAIAADIMDVKETAKTVVFILQTWSEEYKHGVHITAPTGDTPHLCAHTTDILRTLYT